MKERYEINETIPKADGTKVWCINEKIDEFMGLTYVKEVFKGTKAECEEKLKELQK